MGETPEVPGHPGVPEPTWPMPAPSYPSNWGAGGAGPYPYENLAPPPYLPPPLPLQPRRRGGVPGAVTVVLVLIAAAAGVGVGHALWHSPATAGSVAQGGQCGQSGQVPGQLPNGQFGNGQGNGEGNGQGFGQNDNQSQGGSAAVPGSGAPANSAAIAAAVDPALVDVNSTFGYQSAEGAGTGIVLTSTGEILTNNHVIDGATAISVTDVGNGKTYTATVVGYSNSQDLAVLQLQNASGLTTAKIGSSAKAAIGDGVVAIGNAGGTGGTPTSAGGSITAVNQSISAGDELDGTSEQLTGLIQVNADVQEGDSGGSLVNSSGQVIGIDTAASSNFSMNSTGGQGYAIPIDQAVSVAGQITAGHASSTVHIGPTAFLGVMVNPSGSQSNTGFGSSGTTVPGASISSVVSGGSAQTAGLTGGDVITSLNGQNVASSAALTTIVAGLKPGASVSIGWVDTTGQSHTSTIVLGSGPPA